MNEAVPITTSPPDDVAINTFPLFRDLGPLRFFSGMSRPTEHASRDHAKSLVELAEAPFRCQAEAIYAELKALTSDVYGLSSLLRQHLYQSSKRQFPVLETVRIKYEGDEPAPSSGIGISSLRAGTGATYEIDAIGLSPSGLASHGARTIVQPGSMGNAASHYTQAVRAGPYIFLAGAIPLNPDTLHVVKAFDDVPQEGRWLQRNRSHPDSRTGPIAAQTWSLYDRITSLLRSEGLGREAICQTTLFIQHAGDLPDALRVHDRIFDGAAPALQVVVVDEVGHMGTLIEIECTASTDEISRIQGAQARFQEPPDICISGELAFVSDHLGFGNRGTVVDSIEQIPRDNGEVDHTPHLRAIVEEHSGGVEGVETVVAETYVAVRGILYSLVTADLGPEHIGHLWVRVQRPHSPQIVTHVLKLLLGRRLPAVTVLSTESVPYSPDAHISVSATCSGIVSA